MPEIKCTVDECSFYSSDKCTAPKIEVNNHPGAVSAAHCKDTMCETFMKK